MHESSTYQMIVEEGLVRGRVEGRVEGEAMGRVDEARRIALRLGEQRLGSPDAQARAAIEALDDVDRLEALISRLLTARSWQQLLADTTE